MDKAAFEFLAEQAVIAADNKIVTDQEGHTFLIGENGDIREWHEDGRAKKKIVTSTLSSVVDYINAGADKRDELFIHVLSPDKVELLGSLNDYGEREVLLVVERYADDFDFNNFHNREELNIELQSKFVANEDHGILLKFIGNYQESTTKTATDDGVSQIAEMKTGVASVDNVKVPNPVVLKPYRTFAEVEQPESKFIFRMSRGMQGGLFEADNSQWKNEAIKNIKNYFEDKLTELDSAISITVLG